MPSKMFSDRWIDELRAERIDQAFDNLRLDLENPGNFYSLGAVYMWTEDYEAALAHFDEQIRARLPSNLAADISFGMAGAAAWCLGNETLAVKYWRKGTTAGRAIGGANTRTELLLYSASLLNPATLPVESAEQLLIKKAGHPRVQNWPGPIVQYLLGSASEQEVRQKAVYGEDAGPNPLSWKFDFYKLLATTATAGKERRALEKGLQDLVDVKGSEYLAGIKFFDFLRIEEFYLARHWISKRSGLRLA